MAEGSRTRVATPAPTVLAEIGRLVQLAWPVALSQLGWVLMGVVDVAMVGRLGDQALAGVSLGHVWSFSMQLVMLGVAAGMDPVFAQAFGAGHPERAGASLVRGLTLVLLISVPIIGLHLLAGPFLLWAGEPPGAAGIAHDYAVVRSLSVVPFAVLLVVRQLLQGRGLMWPAAVAIALGNVVNVIVNGMFLFGWLGAPVLGPVGTAWATVAATVVMTAVLVAYAVPTLRLSRPRLSALRDGRALWSLVVVCLPVGLQVGLEGWGFGISTLLMGWLGETALAAHTVAMTLASVAFMVPLGISSAGATRVGNLLGAGHAWGRSAWLSIGLGAGVMLGFAAAFLLFPTPLASLFVSEGEALTLAVALLPIAAGFALFDGTQVVSFGVLRGAGDTAVPAVANIVGYYVIGLPLGAVLAFPFGMDLGPQGLWMGIAVALACVAGLLLIRLRSTVARGGFRVG